MLKREIKYEDFNENQTSEICYFNISKPEIIMLEAQYDGGFGNFLQRLLEAKNESQLVNQFKEIILMAYGEKTEDGKHFLKSEELKKQFSQSAAYNQLFMELASDPDALLEFIRGVFPKDVVVEIDQAQIDALKKQQGLVAVPQPEPTTANVPQDPPTLPNMPTR
jgi:hypothetical protein